MNRMDQVSQHIKEYIDSGEYFADAKKWYQFKYITPFSERSFVFLLGIIICVLFAMVMININSLFPLVIKVKYSINADTSADKTAQIIRANHIDNRPLESVTDIMVQSYLIHREKYNYDLLRKQFVYIKNNSTRIVFRRFYNFMNIDNPDSPVLRYQKNGKRNVTILSAKYQPNNVAVINFISEAKNNSGEMIENMVWQATITYEIDKINTNLPSGSRFNFTVTDYQLKLIEDKIKK